MTSEDYNKLIAPGKWYTDFDENGNCTDTYYDDSFRELLGLSAEEFANDQESWSNHLHPDDVDRVNAYFDDIMEKHPEGKDYDIEYRILTKWGYHWFHDYAKISRSADGSVLHFEGVSFDIQHIRDFEFQQQHEALKKEVSDYIITHVDDDPVELLNEFAEKFRVLLDCDQFIFRDLEQTRIMVNSPAVAATWSVPESLCRECEHLDPHHPMYAGGYTEMDNCQLGWQGIPTHPKCPIKSSLTRIVYCNGEVAGYVAIHYVQNYHHFTDLERSTLEEFVRNLSIVLSRYEARKEASKAEGLRRTMNMIFSLSDEFDPIIVIDPVTGEYDWYMTKADDVVVNTAMSEHGDDFFKDIAIDGSSIIHEDDRAQFQAFYSRENLMKILESGETHEIENRWFIQTEGMYKWKFNKVVKMTDESGRSYIVVGVIDTTERKKEEEKRKRDINLISVLTENNQRVMALEDNLESIYDVELESGHYIGYVKGEFYQTNVADKLLEPGDYFEDLRGNIDAVIYPEDRDGLFDVLNRSSLKKALSETDRIEHFYRMYVGDTPQWLKIRVVYKDKERKNVIIGCFDAADEMAQKMRNENLVNTFSKQFTAAYYGNLDDASYQILVRKENILRIISGTNTICDAMRTFAEQTVHPDDRHLFSDDFYTIDGIKAKIGAGESYSFEYRSNSYGEYRWFRAEFRRTTERDLLVGFRDCDDEVLERHEHERLQKEIAEQHALSDGLAREYHTVWLVDGFGEHRLHLYRSTGKKTVRKAVQLGLDEPTYDGTMVKYVMDSVHEDDRERVLEASRFETVQRETPDIGTYVVSYKRYCDDKGNIDYHQMCFAKAVSDDGTVNYILAFRDADKMLREQIAMQNQLEDALRMAQSANLRNDLLHQITNAGKWSYGIDEHDNVVSAYYNDIHVRSLTTGPFAGEPMKWVEFLHPEDREATVASFNAAIRDHTGNTLYDATFRILGNEGTYRWAKSSGKRLNHEDGTAELFGMNFDMTEQMEKEREQQELLEEALAMAQSANRAKTTFLNNMSHDIRTPMNAIIGYTGLAATHLDRKELVQDYLAKISQSSDHLLSLINDVLDMSRIESGKMNLDEKDENLSDIIHTLRDIVQADVHSKQLDFFVDAVDVNDENIVCDKLRLNQVLLNVLSNAIKYTQAGGTVSMRVREKTIKDSGYATYEFVVKDNGMGMSREFLGTIFDPFTRVKSSTVSGIQGTGLGMAITKNIIDMMGGRIDIESEPGKGTEVTVTFDFKLQGSPKVLEPLPELQGMRALVVDDDSNTCLSICNMLREIGMREEWCTSGKEAVIRANEAFRIGRLFKVFIIDWLMPDMNGIETTRRIRKVIGEEIPIIILTAYDWSDIEEEAREAGVTEFVSKPMFPSDLRRVLAKCIGREEPEAAAEPHLADGLDLSGRKILLVEDNELNREIATAILEEYGCVVSTASDGDIAVNMMRAAADGDYDLVLMDVQMPTIDGYEATRLIRGLGTPISRIPILAMTANAFEEDRKLALQAGMDDHIAKPIDIDRLRETLAKYL